MEKIIKEKITILFVKYKTLLEMSKSEHVTQSFKEFYKTKAETTKEQILLLEELLATKEQMKK